MKEKLTLRNVIVWGATFLAILFFFLSFAVKTSFFMPDSTGTIEYRFDNGVWAANSFKGYVDGVYAVSMPCSGQPFALPIVGLILVIVAAVAMVVVSFLIKSKMVERIISIACGALVILGGVFMFFVGETAIRTLCYMSTGSLEHLELFRQIYASSGAYWRSGALGTISGVIFILSGVSFGVSAFLPEKKLAK